MALRLVQGKQITISLTGSFTGSFKGDGSQITGVTAEWDGSHNGNASITGSLIITGGVSGSFSGSGANLFNIPASGITGLNLSQISSGSVSASISEQNGLQVNTNVTATSFSGSFSGSGANLFNIPASGIVGLNLSQITSGSVSASISPTRGLEVNTNVTATSFTGSLFGTSATASHAPSYLPLAGGTVAGSLVIQNNLTVLGSASIQYISESVLNIGTNIITVNTLTPSVRFGGLSVIDSGSSPTVSASLLYDSVQDEFIFVHKGTSASAITSSHFVLGPETYNNLGDEIYLSQNRIPKSVGNEHLNDSNITDSGTIVSINSNTQVTGSLTVTQGISGSFSGSGANLFNIPATGITGLNLSQISSGSVSASISPNSGLQINTNVTATSFTGSLQGTASYATYPYVLATVAANTNAGSLPSTDYVYLVNGAYTITLPNAIGNTSRYDIKNIGSGTVYIATTLTQTIEGGAAPISLPVQYTAVTLVSDNANWHLI